MSSDDHNQSSQMNLFSLTSDLDIFRHLLADLHNDMPDRVSRLRYLIDLGADLGSQGTMLFGGYAALSAWSEARSSFVNGNYVATILLCQSLIENLLAAFLHTGLMLDDLPPRVKFRETLKACHEKGVVTAKEAQDLDVLMTLRNPLIHFRNINDGQNLDRRAMKTGDHPDEILRKDAGYAIRIVFGMLAKRQFRID